MANPYFIERDRCPCCTSTNFITLYEKGFDEPPIKEYLEDFYIPQGGIEFDYLKGAVYSLLRCRECDLIFQKYILNDMLMEKLYEHWIDPLMAKDRHLEADFPEMHCANAQEIMRIIVYFNKQPSTLQFLDFGMGWGEWALMAKSFGCDAYGLELSSTRVEYAKSKGVKVITEKDKDALRFDFINTEQVFEHIPNPLETLTELKKLLKPGGILKISVPHGWNIDQRLKVMDWKLPSTSRNSMNPVAPLEHINCFQRASITKMAGIAKLKEINIPLKIQYGYMTTWGGPAKLMRNLAMPLYQAVWKRSNYLFFTN